MKLLQLIENIYFVIQCKFTLVDRWWQVRESDGGHSHWHSPGSSFEQSLAPGTPLLSCQRWALWQISGFPRLVFRHVCCELCPMPWLNGKQFHYYAIIMSRHNLSYTDVAEIMTLSSRNDIRMELGITMIKFEIKW